MLVKKIYLILSYEAGTILSVFKWENEITEKSSNSLNVTKVVRGKASANFILILESMFLITVLF